MAKRYPCVEVNLPHLKHNVEKIAALCAGAGIQIAGVVKGASGLPEIARAFEEGGAVMLASSRIEQLADLNKAGLQKPKMLIRIPMLSEAASVVADADISLNSEQCVVEALNREAQRQGKCHGVIMMADMGDLREGYWDKQELIAVCEYIEKALPNIHLAGVGFNVGCYGSIVPTTEMLSELVAIAEEIEKRIGRTLEYISGGATGSLMRVLDGTVPARINLLRIGECALLARDLDVFYGYDMSWLYQDVFRLKAEVIEVKRKPSHPVGKIAVDAFGHRPQYVDRGMRKRAVLAMGKVDYADMNELIPLEKGVEIIGASSDHTIADIERAQRDYQVGDIMEFGVKYATLVFLTASHNVHMEYIRE